MNLTFPCLKRSQDRHYTETKLSQYGTGLTDQDRADHKINQYQRGKCAA
jgi:hypothetical protein